MTIDWLNDKAYSEQTLPKKITPEDIALGAGLLNYELGLTQIHFIQYLIDHGDLKKSEEKQCGRAFELHTKGDALHSTLGPLFNKIKVSGLGYQKDVVVIDQLLHTRNYYIHDFVHISVTNPEIDLQKCARDLINAINSTRKLNHRYSNLHAKFLADKKKNESTKKKPAKKPAKTYGDKQMKNFVIQAIDEVKYDDGTFNMGDLGNALKRKGIEPAMYKGNLSALCKRLGLKDVDRINYVNMWAPFYQRNLTDPR